MHDTFKSGLAIALAFFAGTLSAAEPPASPTFERDVLAILQKHCLKCHGDKTRKSGLDLRTRAGALQGGESGEAVVVPGKAESSRLFELVSKGQMPPDGKARLPAADIAIIKRWINAGAAGEKFVSQETPVKITPQEELARKVDFIFEVKCLQCHGPKQQEGGLDFRTRDALLKGGKSGPALVPGAAHKSLLVQRIAADQMPPRHLRYKLSVRPVTEPELYWIRQWIDAGAVAAPPHPRAVDDDSLQVSAEDRKWWSFQAPRRPPMPQVKNTGGVRTPIDAFVLAKLEAAGLGFAPEADRLTLLRRAYLDLHGLPPSPTEIQEFLKDQAPDAYERLLDRLLASPRYGERWAQPWLDAAGYADSEGSLSSDPIYPEFYRYRDYVIRSLNADKPYDRFLLEQLAGDELADYSRLRRLTQEAADNLVATGFLRTAIDPTVSPETNFPADRYQVLADTVEIVSSSLLGLTLRCARCHSHKYDPISQRDYYQFMALFAAAYAPRDWRTPPQRFLVLAGTEDQEEIRKHNAGVDARLAGLKKVQGDLVKTYTARLFEKKLAQVPLPLQDRVRQALQTPPAKRDGPLKELAAKYEKLLRVDAKELPASFSEYKQKSAALEESIKSVENTRRSLPKAHGLTDVDTTGTPFFLLKRGEWDDRGPQVLPNVPAVFRSDKNSFTIARPGTGARTTGRRLALARWLVRPDHPLTARVLVNRVWQQHFGAGIVATPDDFGHTGAKPTHPELLDWLATEFVAQAWSLKKLHRLIMTSSVYRQQSRWRREAAAFDPENKLLWRMPLRRLDAEALRDSVLAVSGQINLAMYGPPVQVETGPDGQVSTKHSFEFQRRSVYMLHRRSTPLTVLEQFDAPRLTTNCVQRRTSTVVSQALLMLNSEFMDMQASRLAARVLKEAGQEPPALLEHAYQLVLGRAPTVRERQLGVEFLQKQTRGYQDRSKALADFCLVLLNSAEFLYLD